MKDRIRPLLPLYKSHIQSSAYNEIHKWKAIATFQNRWNLEAADFKAMYAASFQPTGSPLWTGSNFFPRAMMLDFIENDTEAVRSMFRLLFDESIPLPDRIGQFMRGCEAQLALWNRLQQKQAKQHYHSDRIISLYLAFRYPEKYYLFKYEMVKAFEKRVGGRIPVKGRAYENLINYFPTAQQVREVLEEDVEVIQIHDTLKSADCFQDVQHTLLTQDFIYIIANMAVPQTTPLSSGSQAQVPLNQILFGPPGTGKTYSSISHALQIVEELTEEQLHEKYSTRGELKKAFDEYLAKGQMAFCTFHQSFSYEDFIEGIKPVDPREGDTFLKYKVQDGIFKLLAQKADTYKEYDVQQTTQAVELSDQVYSQTDFYKMSLGNTQDPDDEAIYQYCISNQCIALGWGDDIDFSDASDETEIKRLLKEHSNLPPYAATAVSTFKLYIKPGNIVFISYGNTKVRAIARVVGDYQFKLNTGIRYNHFRAVEWILKDVDIPVSEFYQNNFAQRSIYKLNKDWIIKEFFQRKPAQQRTKEASELKRNHVLIIDEINRGNVSQIFGELITLIESDKRKGKKEALSLILPYSKKEFWVPANLYLIGTMNTADRSVEALDTALRRRFSFVEMSPNPQLVSPAVLIAQLWQAHESVGWEEEPYYSKAAKLYKLLEPSFTKDILTQQRIFDAIPDDYNLDETVVSFDQVTFTGLDPEKLLSTINRRIEKLIDKDHCIGHSYLLSLVDCQEPLQELRNIFANKIIPLLQEYFFGDPGKMELVIGQDFFEPEAGAVNADADLFFAKSSYEGKEDLMSRRVYKLRSLNEEAMPDEDFLKAVKHIYTHG